MSDRRGTVFIAPSALFPADGRMVDPDKARFWVSWQGDDADDVLEEDDIVGANAAIEWGRQRADVVLIRLGHSGDTYFSAAVVHEEHDEGEELLPIWPPSSPHPPVGVRTPAVRDVLLRARV
jgi:hypothetical protein